MGLFSAKSTTFDPMSSYTPQQRASVEALMSLASTGTGGGISLGNAYTGSLGNYDMTLGENQALSGLKGLVGSQEIAGARDVYSRMANNRFNPDDPSSGYAAFSRALAKASSQSQDALNREAARSGGVFGSGRGRDMASLQADLANQRGSFLANLFNQGENRALQGAQGLQSLVGTQQNLFQQLASQAEVERLLKDKQAKDAYQEYQRQQQEKMTRIGLMQDQWQNPMGSITKKSPNTLMSMFGEVNPLIGSYNTHKYGYTTNQTSISDTVKAIMSLMSGGTSGSSGKSYKIVEG